MSAFIKRRGHLVRIAAVFLAVLFIGGCATAIKYSYDTKTIFPEQKSYTWAPTAAAYRQDPLLETNVQALADQLLAQKGLTRMSEKPDLVISMSYEFEISSYEYGYQLRMLTLNVYKIRYDLPSPSETSKTSMQKENAPGSKELVWRGTALGTINTDAASGDLRQAVQEILSHFPPR